MSPQSPRLKPRVLMVEGRDEILALTELLEQCGINWTPPPVHFDDCEGIDQVLENGAIEAWLRATGLEALGILVDADDDPGACWRRVRTRLNGAEITSLPEALPSSGLVHQIPGSNIRIGVWIMPDNVRQGMLETFLLRIRDRDPALQAHAASATTAAKQLGAPYRECHRDKAELRAWLAWQDPPGVGLNLAARKGLFGSIENDHDFVAWFRQLFQI